MSGSGGGAGAKGVARQKIVIVGGGTAGWLTAAYLVTHLGGAGPEGVEITVVEAPDIPTIGVGEGSFPTLRATLASLGVSEAAFLKASSATFKQGVQFDDWAEAGTGYVHPFNLPFAGAIDDLAPHWLAAEAEAGAPAFADAVTAQCAVMRARRAPKRLQDPDFQGPMNYAYHFDAGRFAAFLRELSVERGVRHLADRVESVHLDARGDIRALQTAVNGEVTGDLYVDCSGFRALLIGEALGSPLTRVGDVLFNDRALAIQIPYPAADHPIASATVATAHEAGWTWDIGLDSRRGVGYVFSSRHSDPARAEAVLRNYIGSEFDPLEPRLLSFQTGYRQRQWVGNCVAVGLSAGFFEPLESTGIMLIEVAARMLIEFWPGRDAGALASAASAFNRLMSGRCARIVDFLKLHYCLSRRPEPYWRDNGAADSIPDSLAECLAAWRARPMSRFDFIVDLETFLPASWKFVAYGMGLRARPGAWSAKLAGGRHAQRDFERVRLAAQEAPRQLPPHRELVRAAYARALA